MGLGEKRCGAGACVGEAVLSASEEYSTSALYLCARGVGDAFPDWWVQSSASKGSVSIPYLRGRGVGDAECTVTSAWETESSSVSGEGALYRVRGIGKDGCTSESTEEGCRDERGWRTRSTFPSKRADGRAVTAVLDWRSAGIGVTGVKGADGNGGVFCMSSN